MHQSDAAAAPGTDDPQQLPRRTTPTWDMELLLSGATVFALVQLATWLPGVLSTLAALVLAGASPLKVCISEGMAAPFS